MQPHISEFLRRVVRSAWGLELLLLMRATQSRSWTSIELSAELRGSVPLVEDILGVFVRSQIVALEDGRRYRYSPAERSTENLISDLAKMHRDYPLTVVKEILRAPNDKIQSFVDAFRLKQD